jgi:hypothetical protein
LFQNNEYAIDKEKHGQALCPYDPQHNSTAVFVGKFHTINTYVCCGIAEQMSVCLYVLIAHNSYSFIALCKVTSGISFGHVIYEGTSINKLQIQVATYVFELSAGNCHR